MILVSDPLKRVHEITFHQFHYYFELRSMVWNLKKDNTYLLFIKSSFSNLYGQDPDLNYFVGLATLITPVNPETIRTTMFKFDTGIGKPLEYKGSLYGAEWFVLRAI